MVALLVTLGVFMFFGVVGYALVTALVGRSDAAAVLFSPTVGAALVMLLTMLPNYLGVPVRSFGLPLAIALLVASGVVLAIRRPRFPTPLGPIAAILIIALILAGRPFLEFGFDWLSFVNGDMNTYVHGAERMFEHGFRDFPNVSAYAQNRAVYENLYGLDVVFDNRTGAENILAFLMASLRLDGYQSFMPLIMALNLCLISAATGLAAVSSTDKRTVLATCLVMSTSAMVALGALYQLLGQVPGLALLATSMGLLFVASRTRGEFIGNVCLASVPVAGLAAAYPEVAPFLMLAASILIFSRVATATLKVSEAARWIVSTTVLMIVLVNVHITTLINMLSVSLSFSGSAGMAQKVFVEFLVPSGLANLFGLIPLSGHTDEPMLSISIGCGLVLLAISAYATVVMALRRSPAACVTLALFAGGALLAIHQNGFGLFKLAMYVQPFAIPTVLGWWSSPSLPSRVMPDPVQR